MKRKNPNQPNPYATNRGGKITAPHPQTEEPKAGVIRADDLRVRRSR